MVIYKDHKKISHLSVLVKWLNKIAAFNQTVEISRSSKGSRIPLPYKYIINEKLFAPRDNSSKGINSLLKLVSAKR